MTQSDDVRSRLTVLAGQFLWQLVGVAVGAIGYAAAAGFELEMRRMSGRIPVTTAYPAR